MRVNKRELILITILIVVLAAFLFYQYIFVPKLGDLTQAREELSQNTAKLEQIKAHQEKQQEYQKEINNMKDEIAVMESMLPNDLDLPKVMMELYNLTVETGVSGDRINFSEIKKEKGFDYYNISISVVGAKKNVDVFIQKLENYERQVSIESISIEPSGATDFEVDLSIRNYILKSGSNNDRVKVYDFMNGKYGTLKEWYDMFKYEEKK